MKEIFVIQPTQPRCVRDTYKTFLVYKALYRISLGKSLQRSRTNDIFVRIEESLYHFDHFRSKQIHTLTHSLCVRDTYKTFLVYKALYYTSLGKSLQRSRTNDVFVRIKESLYHFDLFRSKQMHSLTHSLCVRDTYKTFLVYKDFCRTVFFHTDVLQKKFLL